MKLGGKVNYNEVITLKLLSEGWKPYPSQEHVEMKCSVGNTGSLIDFEHPSFICSNHHLVVWHPEGG